MQRMLFYIFKQHIYIYKLFIKTEILKQLRHMHTTDHVPQVSAQYQPIKYWERQHTSHGSDLSRRIDGINKETEFNDLHTMLQDLLVTLQQKRAPEMFINSMMKPTKSG